MENVWIVADDLTGAADTGVKFTQDGPVRLVSLSPGHAAKLGKGPLAVNTETRNSGPGDVLGVFGSLAKSLEESGPSLVYKKIDSVLRGLIALEVATLMRLSNRLGAIVAPAYPRFDRVTVDGIHLVKGSPVNSTETGKDPLRPVTDSTLSGAIGNVPGVEVIELRLAEIAKGPDRVLDILKAIISKKSPFIVACDAKTEEDLATLAEAGYALKEKLVLAGSAGLADPLSSILSKGPKKIANPLRLKGPALFFGGSASTSLRAQLRFLAENDGASLITLDLDKLMSGEPRKLEPIALAESSPLIYNLPAPVEGAAPKWDSRAIAEAFGAFAAKIIRASSPKTVFLSGGDTAREVLKSLEAADIEIVSELSPGVVHLTAGGLSLLTKSGGFGPPELLSELWRGSLAPRKAACSTGGLPGEPLPLRA